MTIVLTEKEFRDQDPQFVAAVKHLEKVRGGRRSDRWGETRRFAGKSAGLHLDRVRNAEARIDRQFDLSSKRHARYLKVTVSQIKPNRKLSPGVMRDLVTIIIENVPRSALPQLRANLQQYIDASAAGTIPDTFFVGVSDPSASGKTPRDMWLIANVWYQLEEIDRYLN